MSQKKIKIASSHKENNRKEPLLTVVEFCLERGGKLSTDWPSGAFHTDAAGTSRCRIIGDTTLQDVLDAFDFPDHIAIGSPEDPYISDTKHRTQIILVSYKDHEAAQERRAKRKARSDAILAEALKKRALKNSE